jgi:hypothetical protein
MSRVQTFVECWDFTIEYKSAGRTEIAWGALAECSFEPFPWAAELPWLVHPKFAVSLVPPSFLPRALTLRDRTEGSHP